VSRLISYVTAVSDDDIRDLRTAYARISKPSEEQFMTAAQKLIQHGLLQGHQEGRADLLLALLEQRFGPLSEATVTRVRAGTATDLDRWALAVLAAPTLDDVLDR
jgi:hypothetical protein